jgi:hypothetical protein
MKEGERTNGETRMRKQLSKVAELGSAVAKPVRKSVRETIKEAQSKAWGEMDRLGEELDINCNDGSADVARAPAPNADSATSAQIPTKYLQ